VAIRTNARLITPSGSTPALLTLDDETGDGSMVLKVRGVRRTPEDLPTGAYLEFDDSELADLASVAGYFVEPPRAWKRRMFRYTSVFIVLVCIFSVCASVFWMVAALLALDLIRALAWLGLGLFLAFIGIAYLANGEQGMLGEVAQRQLANRRFRQNIRGALGRGRRKGKAN